MATRLNQFGEIIDDGNCPSCHKPLEEEWVACPHCGASLTSEAASAVPRRDPRDGIPRQSISSRRLFSPTTLRELEAWARSSDGLNYNLEGAANWALQRVSASADIEEIKQRAKEQRSSGGCFISTVVTSSLGLPDDCRELKTLRRFRDTYMKSTPERRQDVAHYYRIAPGIVESISQYPDAPDIWHSIWTSHLAPAIAVIKRGDNDRAYAIYHDMVDSLARLLEPTRTEQS